MKFIFADSLDLVDPHYDFEADTFGPGREYYWGDQFAHEFLGSAPYDGILASRAIVGDARLPGKYTEAQSMRFRREGARRFFRLDRPQFTHVLLFGDSGAFSYVTHEEPPFDAADMLAFYRDAGFTHGCAVDHIIFEFDRSLRGMAGGSADARRRYELTLANAEAFLRERPHIAPELTPLGVVQGWSPGSMAEAARRLHAMGYDYIALGGMVPLNVESIHACLAAVREVVPRARLHLLGFAKADHIAEFKRYGITSFDTTSPLLRAFKDATRNYYRPNGARGLDYFTAVRVPQALQNLRLNRAVKQGVFRQEDLLVHEGKALDALRRYDRGDAPVDEALQNVLDYARFLEWRPELPENALAKRLERLAAAYRRTLQSRPWDDCSCAVCRKARIEVVLFRGSNRNKRRGFHNLWVYRQHVSTILNGSA
jgi:hypothetical protein